VIKELPVAKAPGPRHAVAVVGNVHAGWPAQEASRVKYLRIAQKVPWPCVPDATKACGFNDLHWMPAAWEHMLGFWDWGHARVIGIVPVETDGSAHFKVPADQTVYFQALDENYLEVRRMRSNVTFGAGETRTCIGCHETKTLAPPATATVRPLALGRPPSQPEPPVWGDRVVPDYLRDIQPILDAHCVRCHGEQEPKGGLDFSRRMVDGFAQSYRTLFGLKAGDPTPVGKYYSQIWYPDRARPSDEAAAAAKKFYRDAMRAPAPAQLVSVSDWMSGAEVTRLRQFGSSQSRLITTLLRDAGHREEVKLSRAEWIALVTWVDLNAQYWGTFVDKDAHFLSRQAKEEKIAPPRRVHAIFPDPWLQPPTGNWVWQDENTVAVLP
jgi:cytochrome c553